jgi:UrcA family protein
MSIRKFVAIVSIRLAAAMLASAALALAVPTAQADSLDGPRQKVVSFKDLNMNTREGIEVAFKRIKYAARDVCAVPDRYDLSEMALRPCVNDAVARAVADVHSPLLTSLYEEKTGKTDKKVILAKAH